ncbi:hypothetical protein FY046_08525 [Erwinia sp. 1181_3]|nr:hypothetical protein [Erwinia rhapontici]
MLPSERGSICFELNRGLRLFCQKRAPLSGRDSIVEVHSSSDRGVPLSHNHTYRVIPGLFLNLSGTDCARMTL